MSDRWLAVSMLIFLIVLPPFGQYAIGSERSDGREVISEGLEKEIGRLSPDEFLPVWVFFWDKGFTDQEELDRALEERRIQLSSRVLWRRSKTLGKNPVLQGDLPLDKEYIARVVSTGCELRHRSNWLNAISVNATPDMIWKISTLPYVKRIQRVARLGRIDPLRMGSDRLSSDQDFSPMEGGLDYGPSFGQLQQINVPAVHDSGFSGAGVIVLMLDTGYYKGHEALAGQDIIAEWDFVFGDGETDNEPEDDPGQHDHGTATWSTLGGYSPGNLIGPAYGASFLLAKTEDLRSETPAEEDNYVAALEWADTLGVDIASASLAYRDFDNPANDYSYSDLDGNTAVISVAVDEAARRGILVCNAIANNGYEGSGSLWTPSDADSMIACGAVEPTGEIAGFSSRGPTSDGRIKPEVCARGVDTYAASSGGGYGYMGGTSLSTPLVGGAAALVLEAHPEWGPMQIREALMATASQASNPDNAYGSGVIDVWSAIYEVGVEMTPLPFSLSLPADGDSVDAKNINFSWTTSVDPVERELWYKHVLSTDSAFSDPMYIWDIQDSLYTLPDTLQAGLYFWKVYSYNSQGFYTESNETFTLFALDGNANPQIQSFPDTVTVAGFEYFYDVDAEDPEGDTLSFSLTVSPSWLSIDSVTGLITGTPPLEAIGDTTVTVLVEDGYGGSDNQTYPLTVLPQVDITLTPDDPTTIPRGETLYFNTYIENYRGNIVEGDFWISVLLPNSNEVLVPDAFLNYANPLHGLISGYSFVDLNNQLFVPALADTGSYRLIGRVGVYPNAIIDEESFEFRVVE